MASIMDLKLRALKTRPNNNKLLLFSSRQLKVVLTVVMFKINPDETKVAFQLIFKDKIVQR